MLCKCRFYPSCSEYTLEAIEHKGAFPGILKGIARILRCNPMFPGGYDPVDTDICRGGVTPPLLNGKQ